MHFEIYIYIYFEEVHFDILKISLVASLYICNHLKGNINYPQGFRCFDGSGEPV